MMFRSMAFEEPVASPHLFFLEHSEQECETDRDEHDSPDPTNHAIEDLSDGGCVWVGYESVRLGLDRWSQP